MSKTLSLLNSFINSRKSFYNNHAPVTVLGFRGRAVNRQKYFAHSEVTKDRTISKLNFRMLDNDKG